MCGICGSVPHVDSPDLTRMPLRRCAKRMVPSRGPNDAGLWNGGHVGLACAGISVIDLFRGHQPMIQRRRQPCGWLF